MLNLDSKISSNLRIISNRQEEAPLKSNLKKVTKNHQMERPHVTFANSPQVIGQVHPVEVPQAQPHPHTVNFGYPTQAHIRNEENIHPQQVFIHQTPLMNQTAPNKTFTQQGWLPPPPPPHQQPQINIRVPQNPQILLNNLPYHLQRANSVQNIHNRDYSQPDRIICTTTNISPACNSNNNE